MITALATDSATAPKPETLAAIPTEANEEASEEPSTAVQRTEFAVDLGSANSVINNYGVWNIQGGVSLDNNTGGTPVPFFNNYGTLSKTGVPNSTLFSAANGGWLINQNGTLDIESGAISVQTLMILTNNAYLPTISASVAQTSEVIPFPVIPGGAETSPHMEKDLTTLMYASTAALNDPTKGPLVKKFLTMATGLQMEQSLANDDVLAAATNVKVDPAKAGQLFADIQTTTSAEPGAKWLGNARTPSQQQSFYPIMAEQWSGSFSVSSFANQLESMFKQ